MSTDDRICLFSLRIKNVFNKSCTENQETHFMLNNYIQKIMTFMRQCGKIMYSWTGQR